MIFADKLIELRKRNGWSQEELAEKMDVSRQSISKWESAQSVPDLNKIMKLADIFGVTTDFLLRDEIEDFGPQGEYAGEEDDDEKLLAVSMEDANEFLEAKESAARNVATGVGLDILGTAQYMFCEALGEKGLLSRPESIANVVFILLIAVSVLFYFRAGSGDRRFDEYGRRGLDTAYGVSGMVKERKKSFAGTFRNLIAGGVVLIIAGLVFPMAVSESEGGWLEALGSGLFLLCVAAGVPLIVYASIRNGSYSVLLEEDDYSRKKKRQQRKTGALTTAYWLIATAVYLAVSFLTGRWDISWLVWIAAAAGYYLMIALIGRETEK